MTAEPIVLVVDDDPSTCTSLRRLFRSAGFAVRAFSNTDELFAHGRPEGPCCLVLDVRLPGRDGVTFYEELVREGINVPTVFITGHGDIPTTVRAMKSGAIDFLQKPFEPDELEARVLDALEADERALAKQHRLDGLRERFQTLTPRERDVFVAVVAGRLNKQVASEYGISEKTVKVHRARVMEKMGAGALADLVRMAVVLALPTEPTPQYA